MNISDKVSLYAIIPIIFIIAIGIVSILFVSSIEARVSIIASTLTAVTLLFYVSERLRESALRKLDYWNKKVLTPEYHVLEGLNPLFSAQYRADHLGRDRDLLKRYARYGRFVKLYPQNFILTLSKAQGDLIEYDKVYQKVLKEGTKRLGPGLFNVGALFVAIGLQERGNFDETQVENHRKVLVWAETTEGGITDKFSNLCKLTLAALANLRADVETFLIENQLALR